MRGKTNNRQSTQEDVVCPQKYCEDGQIEYFCAPEQGCPTGNHFSNRLFRMGISSKTLQQYWYYLNNQIFCMPICAFGSNDSRMPALEDVASVGTMCQWYNRYGRCPDFWPP